MKNILRIVPLLAICLSSFVLIAQNKMPRIAINPPGHSAKIQNIVFTPDGKQLISVAEDKTVRFWDTGTGEMIKKMESEIGDGPVGMLYASAISPDGKLLAISGFTVSEDNHVYIAIIDLKTGKQVAVASGHSSILHSVAFTADGNYLISGGDDGTLMVWRARGNNYSAVLTIPVGAPVKYFSFNSVTQTIAAAVQGKNMVQAYTLSNIDKGPAKYTLKTWGKSKGEINKISYSFDGQYAAVSSTENGFSLWRSDGTLVKDFVVLNMVNAIAFSVDSKVLVALDIMGKGTSYGVPDGNKFSDFKGHDNTVFAAAFTPLDNGQYVVASAGGNEHEIILWNPINGKALSTLKGNGLSVKQLAFGAGLELFIAPLGGKANTFTKSFDFNVMKVNSAPTTKPIINAAQRDAVQMSEFGIDLPKGKKIQNNPDQDGRILSITTDPDGNVVVGSDFSLKMYDRGGFLKKEFVGHAGGVRSLSISANARYMASAGEDETVILWKLNESGAAPTLRQVFSDKAWGDFFASLPIDSLTHEPSKDAWQSTITFLKANDNKAYKSIEETFRNLGETVLPFATLFLTTDNEWVCWTYKGYFACTSSGSNYFGWHVNNGIHKLADFYAADQYFDILYRPEEVLKSINQGVRVEDILRAEGKPIFDLTRLHKPSAVFFATATMRSKDLIKSAVGKLVTEAKSLPVDVDIYNGGGGVKEVNIYLNDKLIVHDTDFKISAAGEKIRRTYDCALVNEENEFKAVVINYQRIESRPDILKVTYTGEIIANASLHIMVIGINKYQNAAYNLNYARPDAAAFVDALTLHSKRIFKSINKVVLYDEEATKENIVKGFQSIARVAKPEDVFVFYYAGHGSLDEDVKDADGDSPFYFVPTNVTKMYGTNQLAELGLSGSQMRDYLTEIKSTKQIVLMDACHSGGALKQLNVRAGAGDEKAIMQLARSSGVIWIASSGSKQFATEFDVLKHGVFTYALLEAFKGKGDNGDHKLTVNELKFYMEERVPELTKQYGGQAQYPTGYIHGNDFPISIIE